MRLIWGPLDRSVQKPEVEEGVVAHQHRTFAAGGFNRLAHVAKNFGQGMLFAYGHAQRMVELDAR